MNKAILVGRVGTDPDVRYLQNDNMVANFSLATSETKKDASGTKYQETDWHKIVLWKHLAKLAEQFVHKGDLISITGMIKYRSYEGKDGIKKYTTEIVANELEFLGKSKENGGSKETKPQISPENEYASGYNTGKKDDYIDDGDDLPFN